MLINANTSKAQNVLMVAKSVYNLKNEFVGVVSTTISTEKLINKINRSRHNTGTVVLLVDTREQIISTDESKLSQSEREYSLVPDLIEAIERRQFSHEPNIAIRWNNGFTIYNDVMQTGWKVVCFISIDEILNIGTFFSMTFLIILCSTVIVLFALSYLQRINIINPSCAFEKDMEVVSFDNAVDYRLPTNDLNEYFHPLRKSVNQILEKAEGFFKKMMEYQEELIAANEELETTNEEISAYINQLKAHEEELTQQRILLLDSNTSLEKSEKRHRAILNVLPDLLFIYDSNGIFLDCQTNHTDDLMLAKEEFIGKSIFDIMPPDISEEAMKCIKEVLSKAETRKFDYTLVVNNQRRHFETRMVCSDDNQVLAIVRDITIERMDQDRILELSYRDHLTGVYNRRYFEEELDRMDKREFLPLAIIMIDVNGLKLTNDAFGHLLGDKLLKIVASNIQNCFTSDGFVARIGGDEFVVVCPNCDHDKAEEMVNRLYHITTRDKLENIIISISAGWEIRTSLTQTVRDVFIKAENHMFRKKLVESQSMRNQTIQVIMQTLSEKSEREKRHSVQVSEWSRKLGEAMKLNPQLVKELEVAGLVHDIGKIAVREEVLNKPGSLTEEEYDEIKKHSESGYQILKSVDAYSSLAEEVLAHHERFDGKGYPRGLKGDEIPLIARIICVANAYEAMIADRSYRKGMSHESALEEIVRCSGAQFDPARTEAFLNLFDTTNPKRSGEND